MNIFTEFEKIAERLAQEKIPYALVGRVAMAFYAEPRFTRDIDLLTDGKDLDHIERILIDMGFMRPGAPRTIEKIDILLYRYIKLVDGADMILDILVGNEESVRRMVDSAILTEAEGKLPVRVARKEDIIALKRVRDSLQDRADIERLLS